MGFVICPQCGNQISAPPLGGVRMMCPACKRAFVTPSSFTAPQSAIPVPPPVPAGYSSHLPKSESTSTEVAGNDVAGAAAWGMTASNSRRTSPFFVIALLLLLVCAGTQAVTCFLLFEVKRSISDFSATNAAPLKVEVANRQVPIPVMVKNSSIDVDVGNISDIDVNLRNHHIIGADPIPVRIER